MVMGSISLDVRVGFMLNWLHIRDRSVNSSIVSVGFHKPSCSWTIICMDCTLWTVLFHGLYYFHGLYSSWTVLFSWTVLHSVSTFSSHLSAQSPYFVTFFFFAEHLHIAFTVHRHISRKSMQRKVERIPMRLGPQRWVLGTSVLGIFLPPLLVNMVAASMRSGLISPRRQQ